MCAIEVGEKAKQEVVVKFGFGLPGIMGSIPGDEGGSDRDFPTLAGGMCFCVSDGYVICVTPDKSVVPFLSKMFV